MQYFFTLTKNVNIKNANISIYLISHKVIELKNITINPNIAL